jgi:HEAT repeat protein
MYAGEEVVRSLLPLLDDPNSQFAEQMAYRLDHQPDKQMLRRVLSAAAKDDANETVRQRAATVLENLDRRQ